MYKLSREDVRVIKAIRNCANLSNGTLSVLTGKNDGETLRMVKEEFVKFVAKMMTFHKYDNWIPAWVDFTIRHPQYRKGF